MSPKKTGNTLSSSLLMYLLPCAPRAAVRGTVLGAVKVLSSGQILPEPLDGCSPVHTREDMSSATL